ERAQEDRPRRPRRRRDEREDPELVGAEPEDERVEIDRLPRPQGDETERGETAHHGDGQEHCEYPLVALQQPKHGVPSLALRCRHPALRGDYSTRGPT